MKPVVVFYATREGHTRRIAEAIGKGLAAHGVQGDVIELGRRRTAHDLGRYGAVIVASPVHAGRHAPEAVAFVKQHRHALEGIRTAFVSVTLSQAGVERSTTTPEEHEKFVADVSNVNERFFSRTGWHPARVWNVAGALLYTRYNFLIRLVMKWIAGKSGGSTDTSRDHEYTDWPALDNVAAAFAAELLGHGES